jgi:hypothetical protein
MAPALRLTAMSEFSIARRLSMSVNDFQLFAAGRKGTNIGAQLEVEIVLNLLAEVEQLQGKLEGGGDMNRVHEKRLGEARSAVMARSIMCDKNRWSQLSVDEQNDLFERLVTVRDGLLAKYRAEHARHSNDRLETEGGSKYAIIWFAIFGFVFAATLLLLIR